MFLMVLMWAARCTVARLTPMEASRGLSYAVQSLESPYCSAPWLTADFPRTPWIWPRILMHFYIQCHGFTRYSARYLHRKLLNCKRKTSSQIRA